MIYLDTILLPQSSDNNKFFLKKSAQVKGFLSLALNLISHLYTGSSNIFKSSMA
jgi:hypothetical protein